MRNLSAWKRAVLLLIPVSLALAVAGVVTFQASIRMNPNNTFTREGILKILADESIVYFSDGRAKMGTFFEGQHRDYVPYDSIPQVIIDALVSAEDRNYFSHGGMDYKAFAYAMLDNLKSMSLRRGGSSLTQQTAKNLFKRRGRTIRGKAGELINAFRLERNFSKQEILEFYLNQFYVSGNGHGVQIAARYFFNKELRDLSILEAAFIAGSVKGPNQYNPFIQDTPAKKKAALEKAHNRVGYVLKQMYRHKKIGAQEYAAARSEKIPFQRGSFQYTLSTNMVKVKRLLESPVLRKALEKHDVTDFMSEGLQIYTTLDAEIQRATEYANYASLSRLDMILRGYHSPSQNAKVDLVSHFKPGQFYLGRACSLVWKDGRAVELELEFGTARAMVGSRQLDEFFIRWNHHQTGSVALPSVKVQARLADSLFKPGQLVYCSVPYRKTIDGMDSSDSPELGIAQKPLLQGGAEVVREGRVLANVGGFLNTGYDRVNQAKRQFGSTFKPIVYAAALESGWAPLDPLLNHRQLFRIGRIFYFPKPDHLPEDTVSIAWAGRRSENIASVYLLYHLFDKAEFARFWSIGREAGFSPDNFSSASEFEKFVRDTLGLVLDDAKIRELHFQKGVNDLSVDLTFEGRLAEAGWLKSLPYGSGFEEERRKYSGMRNDEERLRYRILEHNYLEYLRKAKAWMNRDSSGTRYRVGRHTTTGELGFFLGIPDSHWAPAGDVDLYSYGDSILVEGVVSLATLKRLEELTARIPANDGGSRYTRDNLFASSDFRALAALRYIVHFSRQLGIYSPLDAVLSFPLGVNVITLGEAVNAYQALKDGYIYQTKAGGNQLFIERITLRDGTVLFEDYVDRKKVISDRTRYGLEAILGSVVNGGTGRQVKKELRIGPGDGRGMTVSIPAYGKTGTTNDYRNGAFLGFISAPRGLNKGFDSQSGFTLGTYVGFDDNTPMAHRGFRGTGSSVALPAWIAMAKAIAVQEEFHQKLDFLDLEIQATGDAPLFQSEKYRRYVVSKKTGLPFFNVDDDPIKNSLGSYHEDISQEITMEAVSADDAGATATLLIREE